jgi:energy-coupling factor transporter ATP-binding protein EcfA2
VSDEDGESAKVFCDGSSYSFVLNETAHIAVVSSDGCSVGIYPDARKPLPDSQNSEAVADRLVTSVLSRLPILWSQASLHGATLESPHGVVLLMGQSGVGKSTLSQFLVRDHGWVLHDDDTVMISSSPAGTVLVPMGGAARLRGDAAESLQSTGKRLEGFVGDKIALRNESRISIRHLDLPLLIVELDPVGLGGEEKHSGGITVEPIAPTHAVGAIWEHVFTTDLGKKQIAQRFEASRVLANSPLLRVSYRRGRHSPAEVASVVAGLVVHALV